MEDPANKTRHTHEDIGDEFQSSSLPNYSILRHLEDKGDLVQARINGLTQTPRDRHSHLLAKCNSLFSTVTHSAIPKASLTVDDYNRPKLYSDEVKKERGASSSKYDSKGGESFLPDLPRIDEESVGYSYLSDTPKNLHSSDAVESSSEIETRLEKTVLLVASDISRLEINSSEASDTSKARPESSGVQLVRLRGAEKPSSSWHDSGIGGCSWSRYPSTAVTCSTAASIASTDFMRQEKHLGPTGTTSAINGSVSQLLLPCEFALWGSCTKRFQYDETRAWVDHLLYDHLIGNIPGVTCCWFCDTSYNAKVYTSHESPQAFLDPYWTFMQRMEHIRDHILDDPSISQCIRPSRYILIVLQKGVLPDSLAYTRAEEARRNWKLQVSAQKHPMTIARQSISADGAPASESRTSYIGGHKYTAAAKTALIHTMHQNLCAILTAAYEAGTRGVASDEVDRTGTAHPGPTQEAQPKTQGKRKQLRGSEEPDNESDSESSKKRKKTKTSQGSAGGSLGFACPYLKRYPLTYGDQERCKKSWCSVSRLKTDHILRSHLRRHDRKFKCHRCQIGFREEEHLAAHLRSPIICDPKEEDSASKIIDDQIKQLAARESFKTEADRWASIYHTLFPEELPEDYPTPYADNNFNARSGYGLVARNFMQFVRSDGIPLLRNYLEAAPLNHVGNLERQAIQEAMQQFLCDISEKYLASQVVLGATNNSDNEQQLLADLKSQDTVENIADAFIPGDRTLESLCEPTYVEGNVDVYDTASELQPRSMSETLAWTQQNDSGYGTMSSSKKRQHQITQNVEAVDKVLPHPATASWPPALAGGDEFEMPDDDMFLNYPYDIDMEHAPNTF